MSDWKFDNVRSFHLLWVVLAVGGLSVYALWQKRRALQVFADSNLLSRIAPPAGWLRPLARMTLLCLALASLTVAIAGPRWGQSEQTVVQRGIDVIVLLDVSRSMLARDIAPNRLERAVLSIRDDLLPALGGDRIGIITFAGVPTLTCPLTSDYGFARLSLEDVGTHSSPRGGTLIGDAIRKAQNCFDKVLDTHKLILLITDGEDHESFPLEAARKLWEEDKIPIVAVALGDEREGARVPVPTVAGEDYLKYKGDTVWSKANFEDLRKIARVGEGGAFVPVGTQNFDLGEIYRTRIVPAIQFKQREEKQKLEQPSRYHPFALAALVLVLIDSLLRDGPRPRAIELGARGERRAA